MNDGRAQRRREYEARIVRELRRAGALGRGELVRRTALPRSSVFAIVGDLLDRGVVVERVPPEEAARGRGRPGALVSLDPAAGLVAGVDIGRRSVRAVVANMAHEVVGDGALDLSADDPQETETDAEAVASLVRSVCAGRGVEPGTLKAVGVGVFGPVGRRAEDLCARLSGLLGVTVTAGNNTRLAALAEATWGAGRGHADQVYVRWSAGVGGGYHVAGRPLLGAHGGAGEIGHVCVDPLGPPCACGGAGCLEGYVGGLALLARCRERGLGLGSVGELAEAARAGADIAVEVAVEAAHRLGVVLAGTAVQLDPDLVIVGGELGQLGGPVLEAVRERVARHAAPVLSREVPVVLAELGVNDGALGAVAQVLRERPVPSGPGT